MRWRRSRRCLSSCKKFIRVDPGVWVRASVAGLNPTSHDTSWTLGPLAMRLQMVAGGMRRGPVGVVARSAGGDAEASGVRALDSTPTRNCEVPLARDSPSSMKSALRASANEERSWGSPMRGLLSGGTSVTSSLPRKRFPADGSRASRS